MRRGRQRLEVDGVGIVVHHAEPVGPAPAQPVLVLHGFTGSAAAMSPLVDRLAGTRPVLAVDFVGHGASGAPDDSRHYTMSACVRHVVAVVRDAGPPIDIVGYSMGARVALSTAVERPELVRKLVTIGGTAGIEDPDERRDRRERDEQLAIELVDDFPGFIDRWMALPLFASQDRLGDGFLAASRAQRLAGDPSGLAYSLRNSGTGAMRPLHEDLGGLPTPTLLIAGERDAKFVAIAADLAAVLRAGRVAVVDGAGHATHLEEPERTVELIVDFLDEPHR